MVENRLGEPLSRARTLPGSWYSDAEHHAREMAAVFGRSWVGVGSADDVAAPGQYLATSRRTHARARRARPRRLPAGVPQRVPSPRLAARRRLRQRVGALVPVPRLGLPARRVVGAIGRGRRTGGVRSRRLRLVPGRGHDVRPVDPRQPRPERDAVRSRSARCRARPLPARRARARRAHRVRLRVQLEGAARELLRELPHAVRALAASEHRVRVPDRDGGSGGVRVGPSARAARRVRARAARQPTRATPGGRPSPTSRPPSRSTTAATSRCSRTPRSRASPASRRRSG